MNLNDLNEWGVPLHTCNGYKCDEHWWKRLQHKRLEGAKNGDPYYAWHNKAAKESGQPYWDEEKQAVHWP